MGNKSSILKKKQIKKIIIYVISIFSLIYIAATSGKYSLFPGKLSVKVDSVIKEKYADKGAVVIDSSSKRAIIIDADGNCKEVLNTDADSGKVTYYSTVAIAEDGIYIGEYDRQENDAYLISERIIKYNFDGKKIGVVYEFEYTDENRSAVPLIQDISVEGDKGTALCVDAIKQSVYLVSFSENDSISEIRPIVISLEYPVAAWISHLDNDSVIVRDKQSDFCITHLSDGEMETIESSNEAAGVPIVSADIDQNGKLTITFVSDFEGVTIRFNIKRLVIQVIFWLCCIWLGILIIIVSIRKTKEFLQQKKYGTLNKIISVMLILLLSIFVVAFYSISLLKTHEKNIKTSLKGYASVIYNDNKDLINECLKDYKDDGIENLDQARELEELFESNVNILDNGMKFALVFTDDDGEGYILCDSSSSVILGEKISGNFDTVKKLTGLQSFSSRFSTIIASAYYVKDAEGKICGYVAAYQDMGIYIAGIKQDFFSRTVLLIAILIIIGFVATEGRACLSCISQRKKMRTGEIADVGTVIVRPICFFCYFTSSVNSALLVVILKEIAENAGIGEKGILISASAALINAGFIFGGISEKIFAKIMPQKRMLQLSCMISVICYLICFISIKHSKLLWFTIALFISNIFLGIIDTYCGLLAFKAKSKQQINSNISSAWISGSSIACIMAGFLAGLYGNASIQILGIIMGLLTITFITLNLPANINIKDDRNDFVKTKSKNKNIKLLLKDHSILAIVICIFIPIALFSGYKTYIFPTVALKLGISKSTISNLVAFCNALFFFTSTFLVSEKEEKRNNLKTLLLMCIVASGVFILFCVNSSIWWIVLTIAISVISYKVSIPIIKTLYQTRTEQIQVDKENANLILSLGENSFNALLVPMLLQLLLQMLGFDTACFICGVIGAVGLVGFFILNKKTKFSLSESSTDYERKNEQI